ncbi:P-loop containing nucleoside triphosphate hydrolase protein [Pholiota conissans]|uniref:P-loop containing nucleoside triphosphate hydrolase protein n=1 Tax=Pholiota conissans TaxID=109636 RepID=A0A9P6CZF0_9AGAR|nr:P-loop containing nucleoside triphosphate hydrolase protein [Pholiota conissans]
MWLGKNSSWDPVLKTSTAPSFHFPSDRELNPSQRNAVDAILSNEDINRIVVIHGPPGTGKTTVISAAVTSVMASLDKERTIWLVAQSNVAVKNIAEKLASVEFWDFRILVSKDFHFDWHEHLYEKIEHNVIRSDSFPPSVIATERMLLGSRVLLCTLSMLSNDKLATIARVVPLQTIIFDEASQIEIGDYLPLLVRFRLTLHKLVFIGDDKQLAPYGSTDIPDLESIFEKPHLRENSLFLNIQCKNTVLLISIDSYKLPSSDRMPIPIGNFISKHVYNGKLKSEHMITDPQCCRFVDVSKGKEVSEGRSWKVRRHERIIFCIFSFCHIRISKKSTQ